MQIDDVLKTQNYSSEYSLILNSFIREYDISKANINALYGRGVIDKNIYDNLYIADKAIREKTIGFMIRNNQNIYKEIQAGIMDAKYNLITKNNIDLEDIVSIKNDAVFVKDNVLDYTKFGYMDFKLKNTYTLFLKIKKYEFYYYYNSYNKKEKLDVKGISDSKLIFHRDYFIDFLLALFNTLQLKGIIEAVNLLKNFALMYINRELSIGYYREFNSESGYTIYDNYNVFKVNAANEHDKSLIDIRYNYEIIRDIYGLLLSFYFKKVRQ